MADLRNSWKPVGGVTLEDAAVHALREEGNALVVAGPGAGKTELLAQKACYLLQTGMCAHPYKILAVSFKTDAAGNLADRVVSRCGKDGRNRFVSLTFDGFAKFIVDRFRNGLPEWLRPTSDYVLGPAKDDPWLSEAARSFNLTKLEHLEKSVINAIKEMRDTDRLSSVLQPSKDIRSHLTFKMVFALAQCILDTNPLVAEAVRRTYSHVFLDEFQDITGDQYQMVCRLFKGRSNVLTAVGDSKQRIMVWAGAMKNAFEVYAEDFIPQTFRLLRNYRSAPKLVDLQKQMYAVLDSDAEVPLPADIWEKDDGEIRLVHSKTECDEAAWIAEDVKRAISEEAKPEEICFIFKQNVAQYSKAIAAALEREGIASRIEAEYQEVVDDRFMQYLLDLALLSTKGAGPKTWENVRSLTMTMRGIQEDAEYAVFAEHERQLQRTMEELCESLRHIQSPDSIVNVFEKVCDWLMPNAITSVFPEYGQADFLLRRLKKMADLLYANMRAANSVRVGIERLRGEGVIPLMTIHKCKGLEYKRVYFVGLEDQAFWSFKREPEETRCAFFVAISRAVESLTFTYCERRNEKLQSRSGINEFYDLLLRSGMVEVIHAK